MRKTKKVKKMTYHRMSNIFNNFDTGNGIFTALDVLDFPWLENTAQNIDTMYFLTHSGMKIPSNLVLHFLDTNNHITNDGRRTLANIITTRFKQKWNDIEATLHYEYNPIENYDLTEQETVNSVDEGSNNETNEVTTNSNASTTNTLTGSTTSETSTASTGNTENNVSKYGFNSTDGVNSDKEVIDTNNDVNVEGTQISENNGTQATENHGTESHNISAHEENTRNVERVLTRHGNIGVMSAQQ